jgi:hypothetical protein
MAVRMTVTVRMAIGMPVPVRMIVTVMRAHGAL